VARCSSFANHLDGEPLAFAVGELPESNQLAVARPADASRQPARPSQSGAPALITKRAGRLVAAAASRARYVIQIPGERPIAITVPTPPACGLVSLGAPTMTPE